MSIKHINESFERLASNTKPVKELKEKFDPTLRDLTSSLNQVIESLEKKGSNVMLYESAFQNEIEKFFPDKSWWEVTDVNISHELFESKDPRQTANKIVESIRAKGKKLSESKNMKNVSESLKRDRVQTKIGTPLKKKKTESLKSKGKKRINERIIRKKLGESEEEIKRYSDVRPYSERKYWYFTTHGVQPGSIPKDLNVLEVRDGQNDRGTWGTYVLLDGVLNTNELKYYDMRELAPKEETERRRMRPQGERITAWESLKNKSKLKENKNLKEAEAPADYSPKKQGKAYKVFRVKNGKLYPPMVANPGGQDTPIGKWLIADEGEFAGLSKTGRPQVKSSQGGTLSYRPGWHLGDIPRASQFDRTNKETGEKEFPKDFVWAECSYTMDVDYQPESDEQGYMRIGKDGKPYRSDKYQHSLAGLPKLPKDGYYKYRTNPRPDTVPWVITGAIKVDRLLSDAEVNAILERNGVEPIHRQGGDKTLAELGLRESFRRKKGSALKEEWWENNPHVTVLDHEDEYPTNGQWFEFVFDFYNDRLGHVTETNRGHYKARDINHALEKFWRSHEKASDGKSGFILVSVKDERGKEYISEKLSNKRKLRESKKLTESFDDMEVFMNTWANYNENGADSGITPTGWMSIDDAIEYCEEYADYEPFINDTDNIPFDDINEYSNASSVLQELKELQESGVDEDAVKAIAEAGGYDIKEAVKIAESGDYYFYPGLSSYTDLAYELIDELGGLGEALGDRVVNYIDEEQMRREYRWDIREIMRDSAEQEVDDAHDGEDEDSYDREQEIEDWMDEHEDEYLDMIIDEDIRMAEAGEVDLSNYFDYEAFGRDLSFDGYTIVDNGIIYIP